MATAGYEYSKDGYVWQKSSVFKGLSQGGEYTFYQRRAASGSTAASATSKGVTVVTNKNATISIPQDSSSPLASTPTSSAPAEVEIITSEIIEITEETIKTSPNTLYIWLAAMMIILDAAGIALYLILRKKKKSK